MVGRGLSWEGRIGSCSGLNPSQRPPNWSTLHGVWDRPQRLNLGSEAGESSLSSHGQRGVTGLTTEMMPVVTRECKLRQKAIPVLWIYGQRKEPSLVSLCGAGKWPAQGWARRWEKGTTFRMGFQALYNLLHTCCIIPPFVPRHSYGQYFLLIL